jgi:hypothetical protein
MLPPRLFPLPLLLLYSAALKPASLNLGVTARSLVDSYRTYRSDGRVEPLEEFVASAVAAFRHEFSLDVVLMELDLAEEASSEDRTARRDWLRTVRTTLETINDDAATPTDALSERVATVVAAASENGLQIDRRISAAPVDEEASAVPVDHLVLLTLQAWCNHEGEENEPGAT